MSLIKNSDLMGLVWRVLCLLVFGAWLWVLLVDDFMGDPLTCVTFLPVILVSTVGLARSWWEDGFSIRIVFWFFNYLFFAWIPCAFYASSVWLMSDRGLPDSWVITSNLIIALYIAITCVGMRLGRKFDSRIDGVFRPVRLRSPTVFCGVCVQVAIVALIAFLMGVEFFLFRRGGETFSRSTALIASNFLRPAVLFIGAICMVSKITGRYQGGWFWPMVAMALAVASNLPFSVPRYYAFATITVIFSIMLVPFPKLKQWGVPLLFSGFFLSPILGAFRYVNRIEDFFNVRIGTFSDYLRAGHFDAYEMLANGVGYVNEHGIVWGKQLVGALLFWMPRSIWSGKPYGTGQMLSETYIGSVRAWGNWNLSAPLCMELYINGWVGAVLIGSFVVGYIIQILDRSDRFLGATAHPMRYWTCLYGALVGLGLILFRGDLMNATAFLSGFIAAFVLAKKILYLGGE